MVKIKKKPSDFGNQLMAKQKLKCHYGYITEKQFRNLFYKASKVKGNTSENLIELLEKKARCSSLPNEIRNYNFRSTSICQPWAYFS